MKVVLQRVNRASVRVEQSIVGAIASGYLLLVGITHEDTLKEIEYMARKIANLRVFSDASGKMNETVETHGKAVLSISQFTLYGDASDGNRPSFTKAARPEIALPLFTEFNRLLASRYGLNVQTGVFGAHMLVELENDGPVTILLDTDT
ncbi:MAG: D-aminoacyl-tRNA deacylase [Bacillus subtilis]|nr:D-aminoacyl-tRNA deacylase [Bacillus subtilis]